MSEEEKLIWLFKQVHGKEESDSACSPEIYYDPDNYLEDPAGVHLMKHGNVCWSVTKADLMFDFLIKKFHSEEF